MEKFRSVKLQWLQGQLSNMTHIQSHVRVTHYDTSWQPSINAFLCEDCLKVCVDLAGVAKDEVDVTIEPGALRIRGVRTAPEPLPTEGKAIRLLALEIDSGPFERTIRIPKEVNVKEVSAEQNNGLLWIRMPLR